MFSRLVFARYGGAGGVRLLDEGDSAAHMDESEEDKGARHGRGHEARMEGMMIESLREEGKQGKQHPVPQLWKVKRRTHVSFHATPLIQRPAGIIPARIKLVHLRFLGVGFGGGVRSRGVGR